MADAPQQEWPNQRLKILVPTTTLMIIGSIFLTWRLVYGFMQGRKFLLCDYLLIIANALNIAANGLMFVVVDAGLGRHIMDPSIGLDNILRYAYYLWIAQILNIMAVAILKWSICAYLLVLNFSKLYRIIVWISILLVTAFNFLSPVLTLFGCSPLEANWNRGIQGKCWAKGTLSLSYTQGVTNILTDVVYAVAPIVYLRDVQLSRRTQWGLRIVFLLSIIGTVCSIFKTVELKAITKTQDPTWDGINLSIWSASECSIGIFIASLPPLRKAFDRFFKAILPSTLTSSHKTPQYGQHGYAYSNGTSNIRMKTLYNSRTTKSGHPGESVLERDDESERAILNEEEGKGVGIMKTTKVTVTDEGYDQGSASHGGSFKQEVDWASPSDSDVRGPHVV